MAKAILIVADDNESIRDAVIKYLENEKLSFYENDLSSSVFYDDERLLTVKDIMEYLGVGKDRAYEIMSAKDFPSFQEGRRWLVPKKEFMAYIKSRTKKVGKIH